MIHDQEVVAGGATSPLAARVRVMEALLVEEGVLTDAYIQDNIAYMDGRSTANGARMVARARTGPSSRSSSSTAGRQPTSSASTPGAPRSSSW
jgi:hypothetical protein